MQEKEFTNSKEHLDWMIENGLITINGARHIIGKEFVEDRYFDVLQNERPSAYVEKVEFNNKIESLSNRISNLEEKRQDVLSNTILILAITSAIVAVLSLLIGI